MSLISTYFSIAHVAKFDSLNQNCFFPGDLLDFTFKRIRLANKMTDKRIGWIVAILKFAWIMI